MSAMFRVVVGIAMAYIAGCSHLPASDFERATRVAELPIQFGRLIKEVSLPGGEAQLVWAVPNYRCKPLSEGTTVAVRVDQDNEVLIARSLKPESLTWAYGLKSCHAYGYVYDAATGTSGLKIPVPRGGAKYRLTVEVTSAMNTEVRDSSLWFIYGGRAPTLQMFGPES